MKVKKKTKLQTFYKGGVYKPSKGDPKTPNARSGRSSISKSLKIKHHSGAGVEE